MAKANEALHKDVILQSAGVTATIVLADPIIFLSGFSKQEQLEHPPALVRGSLILRVGKTTKIKGISLNFKGISRTDWPEGIPSDKSETHETKEVFSHEWRLFSAQFSNAEKSSGAHSVFTLDSEQKFGNNDSDTLQPTVTTSTPHELVNQHDAVVKGYRVFNPAEYVYNFELMLPQRLPETLKCNFGNVRWGFTLTIERYGTFKPNLTAHKEVLMLRTLGPSNLERSEPIVISRDWEDLLHYEIIIAGKAFSIGQKFNVAFGLVPLAKVKCHRIRIYITEHTEYFCRNHRIHRVEPSHKFLLMEHKSPDGNRGDLLKSAGHGLSGLTEFEFNVEIPEYFPSRRDYLRPNANTEYIKVYHWIKAVMRLSRQDVTSHGEPKCYEVSIDSPITLVDPRTNLANELPDYDTAKRKNSIVDALKPYREFIQKESTATALRSGESTANNSQLSSSDSGSSLSSNRAILFTRQPSIAPPPFDADVRPPELLPPQYDISKENVQQYEQRYEEYLISTGRLPPSATVPTPTEITTDNASDSNTSTLSQSSDIGSGSTAYTATEDASSEALAHEPSKTQEPSQSDSEAANLSAEDTAQQTNGNPLKSVKPRQPSALEQRRPPLRDQPVPVFSEIIWTEDVIDDDQHDMDVDPRHSHEVSTAEVSSLPNSLKRVGYSSGDLSEDSQPRTEPTSPSSMASSSASQDKSQPSASQVSPHGSGHDSPLVAPRDINDSTASSSSPRSQKSIPTTDSSSPRPIPTRGSISRNSAFGPQISHSQKLRSGLATSAGSSSGFTSPSSIGGMGFSGSIGNLRQGAQGPRLSLKTPTPMSVSAGSPLTSPWSASDSNAGQLFSDRWMERRDSSGSFATSPRYFRQSSVVSMDVTRQGMNDSAPRRDSLWGSRRPSRVSEVQELRDWHPSRRGSETSVAISIAEYQGLHNDRQQASTPLLGEEESEMDIGLEWEHDFEDYEMENDRRSVVSAFYTVLTP